MKSSLELYREFRNQVIKTKNQKTMIQRAEFKSPVDFAGGNKTLQDMYSRCHKKKK